jgi:hypothetical protein
VGHMPDVSIKALALIVLRATKSVPFPESPENPFVVLGTGRSSTDPAAGSETCWHCHGSGTCDCSMCGLMKPAITWVAGECVACKAIRAHVQ